MPKQVWLLIIGTFVNTVGNSFLWPLNSIYIHDHLGKSLTTAGIVLMLNSLAGVFGNLVGGYLFDKLGGYKAILIGVVFNLLSITLLTIWHDWPQYIIFLTMMGFSGGIVYPAIYAIAGSAWPEGGRRAFNSIFLANNVGVAIGPALAGIVADIKFDYVFSANLFFYAVFFVLVITTYKRFDMKGLTTKPFSGNETKRRNRGPIVALSILSISLIVCWLSYSQWSATISSYTQGLGMSLSEYSLLWTINGFMIVAVQPIIRPLVTRWENKIKHQLVLGLILMSLSYIVVYFAQDFKMFAAAMVILTFGEVFFTPVIPMIANKLAPHGQEGFYQGLVNSASTIGRMIGPVFGGLMVDLYGMQILMLILSVLIIVAIIPCLVFDRTLGKEQT
ncbi:MFS transporter [Solibacillus sp. FSL K6-1781]|uniref:Permease of the major facilitator superfamily n=2 Tax=Solibacillus TaxID=648800 RepID=F2F7R3_SOLSS|nr:MULTISPECIES: MFS transporter [Solibacillus]AMO86423.1 multidrug MFS transporter [Solibacillus silvestris]EKB43837.1 Arabinose efflux permease [Solibacillus isronensis B3W22]BAK15538.1 permease of the major facilitator superfamily [Solibacillus silvestris StLB046]